MSKFVTRLLPALAVLSAVVGVAIPPCGADEPSVPEILELLDAVAAAEKRGDNVGEIRKALESLKKSLSKDQSLPPRGQSVKPSAEPVAVRAAVGAAASTPELMCNRKIQSRTRSPDSRTATERQSSSSGSATSIDWSGWPVTGCGRPCPAAPPGMKRMSRSARSPASSAPPSAAGSPNWTTGTTSGRCWSWSRPERRSIWPSTSGATGGTRDGRTGSPRWTTRHRSSPD